MIVSQGWLGSMNILYGNMIVKDILTRWIDKIEGTLVQHYLNLFDLWPVEYSLFWLGFYFCGTGRRNYRFFFFFLISLSIHMLSIFTLCLIFVLHNKEKLAQVDVIVALVLIAIIIVLAIPVFGLTGFHMVLVSRGRTTNEQVTGKFKGGYNPFSQGCWHNCCYTLCGPQYPR